MLSQENFEFWLIWDYILGRFILVIIYLSGEKAVNNLWGHPKQ